MVGEGGGSSIRVGTTGKISVLMTRELESTRCESSETPVSCRRKCQTGPVSVSCGTYARRQHRRTTGNGKSSGGSPRSSSQGSHGSAHRKTCNSRLPACRVPILSSDEVSLIELLIETGLVRKALVSLKLWTSTVGILKEVGLAPWPTGSRSLVSQGSLRP
ncbi:hypothetical protein CK203_081778 [Vitis vinifera]|uniref:Uncharacterized protein n=1 Tax=Vitis vinifera TaxID=29760 RepID=A0A438EFB0_VITVI|nr:hypothetical protein CK203_081778 [Vitis vinifera]